MKRDLVSLKEFSSEELERILSLAFQMKKTPGMIREELKGKSFALIFQKPSNRTRVSFETGIFQLGGNSIYLGPDDISLGKREPTADIARTLSRFVNGIVARVFWQKDIEELAKCASVPVINALSDVAHPCQALADIMTVKEHFGQTAGLKMAYIGDGNNVCNSLILACARVGMNLAIATPKEYEPEAEFVALGQKIATENNCAITLTRSASDAVKGAQAVYTDTWVSMGQEEEKAERLKDFEGYQVNAELMAFADKDHIFLHCLPAHRGLEVTEDVIDGEHSLVFDQAENRLHAQKAVLIFLNTPRDAK